MHQYQDLLNEGDRHLDSAEPDCHLKALTCYQKICDQYEHSPGRTGFREIAVKAYAGLGDIYHLGTHGVPTDYDKSLLNYGKAVYASRFISGGSFLQAKIFISMGDIKFIGGPKHPSQFAHALAYYVRALQHRRKLEASSLSLIYFNIGDIFKTGQPFVMAADQVQAIFFYKLALNLNALSIMDRLEIHRSLVEIYANKNQKDQAKTSAQNYLTAITEWYQNKAPSLDSELRSKLVTQIKDFDRTIITEALGALSPSKIVLPKIQAAPQHKHAPSTLEPFNPISTLPPPLSPPPSSTSSPSISPPPASPPATSPPSISQPATSQPATSRPSTSPPSISQLSSSISQLSSSISQISSSISSVSSSTLPPSNSKRQRGSKQVSSKMCQNQSSKRLDLKDRNPSPGRISITIPRNLIEMVPSWDSKDTLPNSMTLKPMPISNGLKPVADDIPASHLSKELNTKTLRFESADDLLFLHSMHGAGSVEFNPANLNSRWSLGPSPGSSTDINYILGDPYDQFL